MRKQKLGLAVVASLMLAMGVSTQAFGQERPERGGERGRFDPAAMRERMNNAIKERLGASEEEWKVLQPRIEKVQTLQRSTQGGRGGFGGRGDRGGDRGGNRGGDNAETTQSPVAKAASELREITENKDAPAAEVTAKLAAYREARAKAEQELTAAQKELTEVLTPKQEAVLVSMGMLK